MYMIVGRHGRKVTCWKGRIRCGMNLVLKGSNGDVKPFNWSMVNVCGLIHGIGSTILED